MPDLKNLGIIGKPTKYRRSIFVDVDDTCLDTTSSFVRWLEDMNRAKRVKTPVPTDINKIGEWLGVDQNLADHWYKEFANHTWHWGALRPVLASEKVLPMIKAQGWNMIAFAHGNNDLSRAQMRRANLELLYPGVFGDLTVAQNGVSFYPYMLEHDDAICITASMKTAQDTAEAGHLAWLLKHPWNRSGPKLTVRKFGDWHQILEALNQTEPVHIPIE